MFVNFFAEDLTSLFKTTTVCISINLPRDTIDLKIKIFKIKKIYEFSSLAQAITKKNKDINNTFNSFLSLPLIFSCWLEGVVQNSFFFVGLITISEPFHLGLVRIRNRFQYFIYKGRTIVFTKQIKNC